MHATIRSYHGVDQNRAAELTTKVKETLVPQLRELPGFAGYYLVEAGNGIFTSLGLFETPEQGEQSTKLVTKWIRDEKLEGVLSPASPRSRAARSSLAAASPSSSHSSTAPFTSEGPACRALSSFYGWLLACLREALDGLEELTALLLGVLPVAGGERARDAVLDVLFEHLQRHRLESGVDGAELGEDVDAVAVVLDHLGDAPHLALDARQALEELVLVRRVAIGLGLGCRHADEIYHTPAGI